MSQRRAALRHGPRTRRDVVIGYCRPDSVDGCFHDSVVNMVLYDRDHDDRIAATIGYETGPRLANARCAVVRTFLAYSDAQWLCWLDTDMTPGPSFVDDLLAHADPTDRPIVGGLCFAGGRTKIVPTIYAIDNPDGKLESETILSYPADRLIEVGGTGSACLIIHRSVFERIEVMMGPDHPLPWYQDVIVDNKDWGEDLIFCLRARAAGAHIFIHTGIKVGHRKKWVMDEAAFVNYAKRLDEVADGPMTYTEGTLPSVEIRPELAVVQ